MAYATSLHSGGWTQIRTTVVSLHVDSLCPVLRRLNPGPAQTWTCVLPLQRDLGREAMSLSPSVKGGIILTWEGHL